MFILVQKYLKSTCKGVIKKFMEYAIMKKSVFKILHLNIFNPSFPNFLQYPCAGFHPFAQNWHSVPVPTYVQDLEDEQKQFPVLQIFNPQWATGLREENQLLHVVSIIPSGIFFPLLFEPNHQDLVFNNDVSCTHITE